MPSFIDALKLESISSLDVCFVQVMESCFGEQLISDLKQEVAAACEKCHGQQGPALPMVRDRLQAMLAGSALAPQPSHYSQNVQYVAIPVQFQPVRVASAGFRATL